MKRTLILLVILFCTAVAYGANLVSVRTRDYYGVAARIVIEVDKNAKYSVESDTSPIGYEIRIYDTQNDLSAAQYENPVKLINFLDISNQDDYSSVLIDAQRPYKVLNFTMNNPYRIVVDLIRTNTTNERADRLGEARYYDDTQRFRQASDIYSSLSADFADDAEINYLWARLLYRDRNNTKATKYAGMIPESSVYYQYAKVILDRIERGVDPDAEPLDDLAVTGDPGFVAVSDSVMKAPPPQVPVKKVKHHIPMLFVYILIGAAFLITVIVLLLRKKRNVIIEDVEIAEESESFELEDGIKARMVTKLMSDGWTTKEIARELHLSRKDVERLGNNKSLRSIN